MEVLFASSEAHPLIKTGGLADVSGSLPRALRNCGHDIRLVLPAYPAAKATAGCLKKVAQIRVAAEDRPVDILKGRLPGSNVPLYLIDAPDCFDRPGGPYSAPDGHDWPDNDRRFALFCRSVCEIAMNRASLKWRPWLVHCNDWQTGLVPPLLAGETRAPSTLFTVHNLAYQGLFPHQSLQTLQLPQAWWSVDGLEFYGQLSFMKGGLNFADGITTVSPTYAREIQTPQFGYGLEGLLARRASRLDGILNGIDYAVWNPAKDPMIARNYTLRSVHNKVHNKRALQSHFDLPVDDEIPLFGHVGRLVEQKGIDLIVELIPALAQRSLQLVLLGSGDRSIQRALQNAVKPYADRMAVSIGYDEPLAHLIEAGSDAFLMPSRFEPCGLNQMYSLRYGTPPIVHRTGGLADSVTDANPASLETGKADGLVFGPATADALLNAIDRALALYARHEIWTAMMKAGMQRDFSWKASAWQYCDLYEQVTLRLRRPGLAAP